MIVFIEEGQLGSATDSVPITNSSIKLKQHNLYLTHVIVRSV